MNFDQGTRLADFRAIVILIGTVEAAILVVIFIFVLFAAVMAGGYLGAGAFLYGIVLYMVRFGPSLICALAGLGLGIKNRWLPIALALLTAAILFPFVTIPLVGRHLGIILCLTEYWPCR